MGNQELHVKLMHTAQNTDDNGTGVCTCAYVRTYVQAYLVVDLLFCQEELSVCRGVAPSTCTVRETQQVIAWFTI